MTTLQTIAANTDVSTILLVDDRPENLFVLETVLEDSGYNLLKATSGYEALRMVSAHNPDLVLMDVQMPIMDGFTVAKLIRNRPKYKNLPIFFITAKCKEQADILKGYAAGGENYLFKPIEPDVLKKKIHVSLTFQNVRKVWNERIKPSYHTREVRA